MKNVIGALLVLGSIGLHGLHVHKGMAVTHEDLLFHGALLLVGGLLLDPAEIKNLVLALLPWKK